MLTLFSCAPAAQRTTSGDPILLPISLRPLGPTLAGGTAVSQDRFGALYILDELSSALYKYSASGDCLRSVQGIGSGEYEFREPADLDASLTNAVLVADRANNRLLRYSRELAYVAEIGAQVSSGQEPLGLPGAISLDRSGNIYYLDGRTRTLRKLRSDGTLERVIGEYGGSNSADGLLSQPLDIAIDGSDNLYVLDRNGSSIVSYDKFGTLRQRGKLETTESKVAASDADIYLLNSRSSVITVLSGEDLSKRAVLTFEIPDPAIDISVVNGTILLVSRSHAFVSPLPSF